MSTDPNLPDNDAPRDVVGPLADSASTVEPPEQTCLARIEEYDDAPDECTIYPADATQTELTTTWVSARANSFIALETMR